MKRAEIGPGVGRTEHRRVSQRGWSRVAKLFCGGLALACASAAPAQETDVYFTLEGEWREFLQESQAPGREMRNQSVALTAETVTEWNRGDQLLTAIVFGRVDSVDDERTHADIRELSFVHAARDYELRAGIRKVFWGVIESRHLVDIINQSDFVEDIDNEAKLGQPMFNPAWITDYGTIDLFWLPYFRERTYPGEDGRPALPLPLAEDEARYQSDDEQQHQDWAARYRHTLGPADIGISYFDGTARQPRLLPCVAQGSTAGGQPVPGTQDQANCDLASAAPPGLTLTGQAAIDQLITGVAQQAGLAPTDAQVRQQIASQLVLVPFYDQIRQIGIDAQVLLGGWALKLEATRREQRQQWTNALAAGFEYTLYGVFESAADVGLLAEYLYDARDDFATDLFDNDVFVGTRIALNDVAGTTLLAGAIVDADDQATAGTVEFDRRINESLAFSAEARLFTNVPEDSASASVASEDFVAAYLRYYF